MILTSPVLQMQVCDWCISLQAYLIGVVWSCYKYLCSQQVRTATGNRTYGGECTSAEDTEVSVQYTWWDVLTTCVISLGSHFYKLPNTILHPGVLYVIAPPWHIFLWKAVTVSHSTSLAWVTTKRCSTLLFDNRSNVTKSSQVVGFSTLLTSAQSGAFSSFCMCSMHKLIDM